MDDQQNNSNEVGWLKDLKNNICNMFKFESVILVLATMTIVLILLTFLFSWKLSLPLTALVGLMTGFIRILFDMLKQQRKFNQEWQIQDKEFKQEWQIQQKEFTNTMNLNKKGPIVEEVLQKLHEYAFNSSAHTTGQLEENIKEISLLLNKVLIYFQNEGIIDKITEGLEFAFRNQNRSAVNDCIKDIRELFHKALYPNKDTEEPKPESNGIDMEKYLCRIYKSFLGARKDCSIFPIEVQTCSSKGGQARKEELEKQWLDVRYSKGPIKLENLKLAAGERYTAFDNLKVGDLLVFWAEKAGDEDGIIGIMSVEKLEGSEITLGRRRSVELEDPYLFSELETAFAEKSKGYLPMKANEIDYHSMVSLFDVWDQFRDSYQFDKSWGIPARIQHFNSKDRIFIDFDLYKRDAMAKTWLYNFFLWYLENRDITFIFKGMELKMQEFELMNTTWEKKDKFSDINPDGTVDTSEKKSETRMGRAHTEIILPSLANFDKEIRDAYFELESENPPRFILKEVGIEKCTKCKKDLRLGTIVFKDIMTCANKDCNEQIRNIGPFIQKM